MATSDPKYHLELLSAQEHIPMCRQHDFNIDITCEDCDVFICKQCARTDHQDHDWKTIPTAGSLRRKELSETLSRVKEKDMKAIDEKIKNACKQMAENQKYCESEVSKLYKHFDAIVSTLDDIKKKFEKELKECLDKKNVRVSETKLDLEKRRYQVDDLVKFLEEKHSTMSDYSLIDNLKELTILVSNIDCDLEKGIYSVRYREGGINERSLETMMGQTFYFEDINATETDSFQHGNKIISVMEAVNDDTCFVGSLFSGYVETVDKRNENGKTIDIDISDLCVTDNGDVYATDHKNKSIVRLSPSGSVSTVFSTAPLTPEGICQSAQGGLLVILREIDLRLFQIHLHNRCLVRHVTLTGDVIRKYEYQNDGRTRLFHLASRIKQNGNTDICVVNRTTTSGELVIIYLSGSLKRIYLGQTLLIKKFRPNDVVCDSHCNIIVNDNLNCRIHLLSPDGDFMKYLLTENEVKNPSSMSLYKSTLWIGNTHGLVKVFQYFET